MWAPAACVQRLLPVVSDCLPVLQLKKNNLLQFQEIC
jgi:hypothetical protein